MGGLLLSFSCYHCVPPLPIFFKEMLALLITVARARFYVCTGVRPQRRQYTCHMVMATTMMMMMMEKKGHYLLCQVLSLALHYHLKVISTAHVV